MTPAEPSGPRPLALAGLKVVDFSRLLPGPYASLVLADLGAAVTKIETPRGGDYLRWMPPLAGEFSYAFNALNTGKRSLAVDLKRAEGVEIVRRLCSDADVVLESFRPGVMERLGLGYDALEAINPGLIYCAISGYGQDGPYKHRAGHDLNYQALGGVTGLAGPVGGPPMLTPVQIADIGGGSMWALVGILAALHARAATGKGRFVDVSMSEGALAFLQMGAAAHLAGAGPAPPRGDDTLTGGQPCYGVYETSDGGFMTVAALEPKFWQAFCGAVDRPDLLNKQYGSGDGARRTRSEITALFASRTRAEWEAVFAPVDACVEPVLRVDELASHPLHVERRNVIEDAAGIPRLRTPIRPRDADAPAVAPGLGGDTRELLEELGYETSAIEALLAAGVVALPKGTTS